jgi:hypothetical protein
MSQFVETRVGDFLETDGTEPTPARPTPAVTPAPRAHPSHTPAAPAHKTAPTPARPVEARPAAQIPAPMTSAAARYAVDPPPPVIKPRQDTAAPKPAEKRPDQIFTF